MTNEPPRPVFEIAWTEVEQGWRVLASDGTDVGKVEQGVGDRDQDIFEGFEIDIGIRGPDRFVSYEHVIRVSRGTIRLDLSPDEVKNLPEHREVPSLQIEGDRDSAGVAERAETGMSQFLERHADDVVESTDERPPLWRRILGRPAKKP
jgi:hypothetical protein